MKRGIIYVMWNELFPELVKIGRTSGSTRTDVEKRRQQLSSGENMPHPFEAKFAICVNNYEAVEAIIHKGLDKLRHNPHREFFRMSVQEAVYILNGYVVSGAAEVVHVKDDYLPEEKITKQKVKRQRNKMVTFKQLGLPVGTKLEFAQDRNLFVKTANDKWIVQMPDGGNTTICIAARQYRNRVNPDNGVDGALDFMYKGKTLWQMFLEKQRADVAV